MHSSLRKIRINISQYTWHMSLYKVPVTRPVSCNCIAISYISYNTVQCTYIVCILPETKHTVHTHTVPWYWAFYLAVWFFRIPKISISNGFKNMLKIMRYRCRWWRIRRPRAPAASPTPWWSASSAELQRQAELNLKNGISFRILLQQQQFHQKHHWNVMLYSRLVFVLHHNCVICKRFVRYGRQIIVSVSKLGIKKCCVGTAI